MRPLAEINDGTFTVGEEMQHPPYQLRTSKAVDRLMLVDVLRVLESASRYREFTYYTLGGPFLEDIRIMEHFFPEMQFVSLESNKQTYLRQQFHKFSSRISLKHRDMTSFLTRDYEPGEKDIFWLDYTDIKYPHFTDFQVVLKKVPPGSVVRITLRAEPEIDLSQLKDKVSDEELKRLKQQIGEKFQDEFGQVLPHEGVDPSASLKDFARMVQLMVRRAASNALDRPGSGVDFLPVQSMRYNDQTQMLTVTGIVCRREEIEATRVQLQSVHFVDFDWAEPSELNIPSLSVKERLRLEPYLPVEEGTDAGEWLFPILGYRTHDSDKTCKKQLAHYADIHRDYPYFVRISI